MILSEIKNMLLQLNLVDFNLMLTNTKKSYIHHGAHEAKFLLSSNKYVAKIAALKLKLWPAELLILKAEGVGFDQDWFYIKHHQSIFNLTCRARIHTF